MPQGKTALFWSLVFAAIFLITPAIIFAESNSIAYADLDGNGINDNIPDSDGDGIPDPADPDYEGVIEVSANANESGDFVNFAEGISLIDTAPVYLNHSQHFGVLDFSVRNLSENRIGFDCDDCFGSDLGIGIGSGGGGGGACAGGVCH